MEHEINTPSSFNGRLSRFAYVPPSSSPSFISAPPDDSEEGGVRKQNWAKVSDEVLDGEDENQVGRANLLSESRKRKSKHLGGGSNSSKPKRSKAKAAKPTAVAPKVDPHLKAVVVSDHVTHDLDGTYHTDNIQDKSQGPFFSF
jgi:hypothetical protein